MEVDGNVIRPPLVHRLPVRRPHEKAPAAEAPGGKPLEGILPQLEHVDQLHPFQVLPGGEGPEEGDGGGRVSGNVDPPPGTDAGDGLLEGHPPLYIGSFHLGSRQGLAGPGASHGPSLRPPRGDRCPNPP